MSLSVNDAKRGGPWARTLGVVAGLLVVLVAAFLLYPRLTAPEVTIVALRGSEVVRTLVVAGRARAPARSTLGTSVPGVLREIRVREGDTVSVGEVLARLDDDEAAALLSQARARLVTAEASARDALLRAELEVEDARRDAARIRSVFAEGGLTQQRVEEADRRVADAESRLAALAAGSEDGGVTAAVTEARAAVEAARARFEAHVVTAPFGGTVLVRRAEPGDAVQAGQGLVVLAAAGPTELVAFPAEENLARLRVGAGARASADAYPDRIFPATVILVAPSVDADQGTVEVRLSLDEPVPYLRPGMTVSVNLELERRWADLVLPTTAIRELATGDPWVAVVSRGRVQRRPVVLGAVGDTLVEIVSGLDPDASVVETADEVEPGDRVRTVPRA